MNIHEKGKKEIKGFIRGFKEFITKGNIIDLAVAVIIGAAFGKIITSFVNDIIMPPVGYLLGGVEFSDLAWQMNSEVTVNYGAFIQTIVEFLLIALSIYISFYFLFRKRRIEEARAAKLAAEQTPEPEPIPEDIKLLTEIRDLLKQENK